MNRVFLVFSLLLDMEINIGQLSLMETTKEVIVLPGVCICEGRYMGTEMCIK